MRSIGAGLNSSRPHKMSTLEVETFGLAIAALGAALWERQHYKGEITPAIYQAQGIDENQIIFRWNLPDAKTISLSIVEGQKAPRLAIDLKAVNSKTKNKLELQMPTLAIPPDFGDLKSYLDEAYIILSRWNP